MAEVFPVVYVLMRTDMASMNPGKGMAQSHHASSAFSKKVYDGFADKTHTQEMEDLLKLWQSETDQGFGTVLTLPVNEREMRTAVQFAKLMGFMAEIIHDPSYPLVDGDTVHRIPVDTCAYIFGDKNDPNLEAVVGHFPLHP